LHHFIAHSSILSQATVDRRNMCPSEQLRWPSCGASPPLGLASHSGPSASTRASAGASDHRRYRRLPRRRWASEASQTFWLGQLLARQPTCLRPCMSACIARVWPVPKVFSC
jgi:hypothetical protein